MRVTSETWFRESEVFRFRRFRKPGFGFAILINETPGCVSVNLVVVSRTHETRLTKQHLLSRFWDNAGIWFCLCLFGVFCVYRWCRVGVPFGSHQCPTSCPRFPMVSPWGLPLGYHGFAMGLQHSITLVFHMGFTLVPHANRTHCTYISHVHHMCSACVAHELHVCCACGVHALRMCSA